MKIRGFLSLFLAGCLLISCETATCAAEIQPRFAITDEAVIIDYVAYEIVDNTIEYNGKTYEIDNYMLVRHDDIGNPIYFPLPVEQAKVTDLAQLAELNASIGMGEPQNRATPSNPVSLPYTANVSKGDIYVISPDFIIKPGSAYYAFTNLELSNFSFGADKNFYIIFSACDAVGDWYSYDIRYDFSLDRNLKFENYTHFIYGRFSITNLNDNPSPSYSYKIYLSEI